MTYVGATLLGPGLVRHTAAGKTFIGEPHGRSSARATELASALSDAGLPTEATDELWSMVWGKLVINAALNATAALLGAGGTEILNSKPASELVSCVAGETAAVASALGIQLPYADPAARVLQHCRDIGAAKPSMLQDVERRRPTEIDAINGAIVREGTRLGIPTPYNHALLLLVRATEELYSRP
jgi:2-dehydropantoate 2-reductase